MAITDNVGYVKPAMAGLLTLLAAPSAHSLKANSYPLALTQYRP